MLLALSGLSLAGCASHNSFNSSEAGVGKDLQIASAARAQLPSLDTSEAGKFSKRGENDLGVEQVSAEVMQADAAAFQSLDTTDRISSLPVGVDARLLGRWVIRVRGEEKANRLSKLSALAHGLMEGEKSESRSDCLVQFASEPVEGGYKADGAAACPTMLFMLESWRPYGDKVILKNHMGDEILRLGSRSGDLWVGVDDKGQTYVMERESAKGAG